MAAQTAKEFGSIDILINNAGALWWKKVVDTPMKRFDLMHGVNSRGSFNCAHAVLPNMIENGHGHIINMSPPIDLTAMSGKTGYCITKYGMTMLTHGLAGETKGLGVACNSLWPATMIESFATINFKLGEPKQWRKADIMSDSVLGIIQEDPNEFSGHALIDEDYLRTKGVTDFKKYRYDPEFEPPRLTTAVIPERGHVSEAKEEAL
eukprot:TRINITY_DN4775_c0_g1_i2.p1 TRINITY_DN4775_c0_g1~~TRINITY_DN4775_c0_g1_i2.p1  ORF type:complete len:207 (+),score=76.18 TRINITY_DN4775_c0_g1_i2:210-830(+)